MGRRSKVLSFFMACILSFMAFSVPVGATDKQTLYAQWEKTKYNISYDTKGGTLSSAPDFYYIDTPTVTLPKPTRTDYNFTGWTGSNGSTPQLNTTIPEGSVDDKSYVAHWVKAAETYIIKRLSDINTQQLATLVTQKMNNYSEEDISSDSIDAHGAADQVQQQTTSSFSWVRNINSSIGSLTIDGTGKNINFKGNQSNAGSNAIWYVPTQGSEQKFTFTYNLNFGDSFNSAGFLLRVKDSNPSSSTSGTITGYAMVLGYRVSSGIYKFSRPKQTSGNISFTQVQALGIPQNGTITVTATQTYIEVEGPSFTKTRVSLDDSYVLSSCGAGYGFYSDHYSHNCSNIGNFDIQNLTLVTTTVLSMSDVIGTSGSGNIFERSDSIHFLINVDNQVDPKLTDQSMINRLKQENAHIIFIGSSTNRTQAETFINAVGAGTFILSTGNVDQDAQNVADYMHTVLKNS